MKLLIKLRLASGLSEKPHTKTGILKALYKLPIIIIIIIIIIKRNSSLNIARVENRNSSLNRASNLTKTSIRSVK